MKKWLTVALVFGWALGAQAADWAERGVANFPPTFAVTAGAAPWAAYWPAGFAEVFTELTGNLRMPKPPFTTRYAVPAPGFEGEVYLWDTAFIAQVWKLWDVKTAQEVTLAVLDHADQGRLRHVFGAADRSKFTQPPLMAWSVWELYLWSKDRTYLNHAYPILKDYNRWLYENRRLSCGLFCWRHPDESGLDNSPRFTSAATIPTLDIEKLAAVDLSCYLVVDNEVLAKMAVAAGFPEDAAKFNQQAAELKTLINTLLYDPATGLYYDRYTKEDRLVKIKTIASLFPLWAGVPDAGRAKLLRDHIMDPKEFNTPFPIPSVAINDPTFEKDMWRGPVWINTAYLVILGLERYGYQDEAAELSFKVADGVYRNFKLTGRIAEFYDPLQDGFQALHREHRMGAADKPKSGFVGWTGLVNNLVVEHLIGFHKETTRRFLAPRFPLAAQRAIFRLVLPGEGLELELTPYADKIEGRFGTVGIWQPFSIAPGTPLNLTY